MGSSLNKGPFLGSPIKYGTLKKGTKIGLIHDSNYHYVGKMRPVTVPRTLYDCMNNLNFYSFWSLVPINMFRVYRQR